MISLKGAVVLISDGIDVIIDNRIILIKGSRGTMSHCLHDFLNSKKVGNEIILSFCKEKRFINSSKPLLGTTCSLLRSMLIGVSVGFVKKLQLVGVGYRAILEDNVIILNVGFSHVIRYKLPNGIDVICPTPVDIVLNSMNKQLIGQVAADLRAIRPPEPFNGKGIRYADEVFHIKEVKKK